MVNCKLQVNKNTLTITVDLSKNAGLSKSGKTILVASTQGSAEVPGAQGTFVGLNVFKYPQAK